MAPFGGHRRDGSATDAEIPSKHFASVPAFIASAHALLADWAGAAKMGVDPYASPVNAVALRDIGLPPQYEIDGDLAPYPLWRNVHPLIAHSARLRNRSDALGEIAAAVERGEPVAIATVISGPGQVGARRSSVQTASPGFFP